MSRKPSAVGNAGDPEQQEKAKLSEKAKEIQQASDLTWVMSEPAGRRFLHRLFAKSGIWTNNIVGPDETMQFYAGMRYVGLSVWNDAIDIDPKFLATMLIEVQE